ncbi:MAG TPA: hypothetical protein VJC13_02010 [Candidatus Paceibacterota bacterium]|nr:hypothetical protein [uncultured archaeon]
MQKIISKALIATLLLGGVVAYAETNSATENAWVEASVNTKKPTLLQRIKNNLDVKKEVRVETKAQIKEEDSAEGSDDKAKATTVERVETKLNNRFEKMNDRFDATIERLANIMSRIESRIAKIKAAGGDTTVAERFVTSAKADIATAKDSMISMKTSVNTTVSLEIATTTRAQAKEALQNLVKISQGLQKNLNDARVSLAKAVGNLRGLKVKTDVEATTTAQVNSQN